MRVAVIGLGLIGSSIGLGLKQANWQEAEIIGYVRRPEVASSALRLGAIDKAESSLTKTVQDANLVIVATPTLVTKDIFSQIAIALSPEAIVTDTASTKLQIMEWAEELLPSGISFIGGHPMAGKETFGIEAAEASLFRNCIYCLTPAPRAKPAAIQIVMDMIEKLGATPLIMNKQEHDNLVAGISHLPLLLSAALVSVITKDPSYELMSQLAGSGYRDVTRLASGNPEVNAQICLSNRSAIISWIDKFSEELLRVRGLVAKGDNDIQKALAAASEARQKWLEKRY